MTTNYLEDYNATSQSQMKLVLFMNAIEHISRVSRIISQPNGNALLVGVGGSGRKSLTTLAVFIADFTLFQVCLCACMRMSRMFLLCTRLSNIYIYFHVTA